MGFPQRYDAAEAERRWQEHWALTGLYAFQADDPRPIFAIDTPPPTVSGDIHIGHVYSYVQAEAMARFWRMQGYNVYYPFGFDDNGLPTERFVERRYGVVARDVGRARFIALCLALSGEVEDRFEGFWKCLGMSVDWRLRYSTIDVVARRTSQWSFIELYRKGLVYRAQAPNPWCVECQTAIAQAEMEDVARVTSFFTLAFRACGVQGGEVCLLPIATTRPELLPACVAVMVHPEDARFADLIGGWATIPLFGRRVPIIADPGVDREKGSGAVMCCTFGDMADVAWWRSHQLPLISLITRQGCLSSDGGAYAGLTLDVARARIVADLAAVGGLLEQREVSQSIRVHERCGTPLEILETHQWFVRVCNAKQQLLDAGRRIVWHPAHMQTRYEHWVENLSWDWCISRQRFYGVTFPVWYCRQCGAVVVAEMERLPVDPSIDAPMGACACGGVDFFPEEDVMDTWATSSLSPQIAGRFLDDPVLYARLSPMALRPQAHDIIRTWAFYTIVKSLYHFDTVPWGTLMISGHGLDAHGHSIHKSKGNAPIDPSALITRYSADAVRYWACSGGVGADQPINEEVMRQGARLVNKLWNAARFVAAQIQGAVSTTPLLLPPDRALLSWLQRLVMRSAQSFRTYEYAAARDATERFFWAMFCDNYVEWVKGRLYDGEGVARQAAQYTLFHVLQTVLKLFAPIMPHITEEIYAHLYAPQADGGSIHVAAWPEPDPLLIDEAAERVGDALLAITASVRRFKSAQKLGMGTELTEVFLALADAELRRALEQSQRDICSVTRARTISFLSVGDATLDEIAPGIWVGIAR